MSTSDHPLIEEFTRLHTFTKEINHASAQSEYFNENLYCKNWLPNVQIPSAQKRCTQLCTGVVQL